MLRALDLDHVLIAVPDLATAARDLEARHGSTSVAGGRHPGWGTGNRIVPLGDAYLELIAVFDQAEAAHSPFGRWVATAAASGPRLLGWCVRTRHLGHVAHRLGLTVAAGSRITQSGQLLRWRAAGLDHAAVEPALPFFIEWADDTPFPGRAEVRHRSGTVRIASVQLTGDADRLASWLGPHQLPVTIRPGSPAFTSVVLTAETGKFVLQCGS
jgi:hypothetical protein